jgi:hypothetical protein
VIRRKNIRKPAKHAILKPLEGGDRRSIGRANAVVAVVEARPKLFRLLVNAMSCDDRLVRMRAADAAEKISAGRPELLAEHKQELLRIAGSSQEQEIRWHMAAMIPRLPLAKREHALAQDILFDYLRDKSSIVKTFAMQGLADLAAGDAAFTKQLRPLVEELTAMGTPAMRARGRQILKRWDLQTKKRAARTPSGAR